MRERAGERTCVSKKGREEEGALANARERTRAREQAKESTCARTRANGLQEERSKIKAMHHKGVKHSTLAQALHQIAMIHRCEVQCHVAQPL